MKRFSLKAIALFVTLFCFAALMSGLETTSQSKQDQASERNKTAQKKNLKTATFGLG